MRTLIFYSFFLIVSTSFSQDFKFSQQLIPSQSKQNLKFGFNVVQNQSYVHVGNPNLYANKGGVSIYKKNENNALLLDTILSPLNYSGQFGSKIAIYDSLLLVKLQYDTIMLYEEINSEWVFKLKFNIVNETIYKLVLIDNMIIITAADANSNKGRVYIYKINSTNVELSQILESNNPFSFEKFGMNAAISPNKQVLAIGSYNNSIFIYQYIDSTWNYSQTLISESDLADAFGTFLEINNKFLLAGDWGYNNNRGAINIYEKSIHNTWVKIKDVLNPRGHIDEFYGNSVSISDSTFVIGAPAYSFEFEDYNGFVHVLQKNGNQWLSQIISPQNLKHDDEFGGRVSIHKNNLLISAPYSDSLYENSGSVYVYQRDTTTGVFNLQSPLANNFSVYPNPSNHTITVRFSKQTNNKKLSLYNSLGQLVLKQLVNSNMATIPVTHLPNGVYHLRYNTQVETVIVNH